MTIGFAILSILCVIFASSCGSGARPQKLAKDVAFELMEVRGEWILRVKNIGAGTLNHRAGFLSVDIQHGPGEDLPVSSYLLPSTGGRIPIIGEGCVVNVSKEVRFVPIPKFVALYEGSRSPRRIPLTVTHFIERQPK